MESMARLTLGVQMLSFVAVVAGHSYVLDPDHGVHCTSRVVSKVPHDHVLEEAVIASARDAPLHATNVPAKSISFQTLLSKTTVKSNLQQHFRITLELGRMVKLVAWALL